MEKIEFLVKIKELVASEDVMAVNTEINELKSKFQDVLIEKERLVQVAQLENGEEVSSENLEDPERDEFFQIYSDFKARKTAFLSAQKLEQEANLRLKKKLIDELKSLISEEENIGVAVSKYKEIQESWKNVGDIPRDKRQDIQNEYSKLLESFFYTLKIYRELKDHDLKRNTQLKNELVEKIKELTKVDNIKELESSIKALQNEFDEIGPVVQEDWDALKTAYWENVKLVYAKIHTHYEGKREQLKVNIEQKAALLDETKTFIANLGELNSIKEWDDKTHFLLEIQNRWKAIGFGTKKENEELWVEFRAICNEFFDRKKVYFNSLKEKNAVVADAKKVLIAKAVALKDQTTWKETSQALVRLQQDWKKTGSAGPKLEQALWKEFRAACDAFFNTKDKYFAEIDKANEVNLQAKLDVIAKIEAFEISSDKKKSLEELRNLSAEFNAVGNVPFKEKDTVYTNYKKAIDLQYGKLKLEGEEKEKAFFNAKLDALKANPNSDRLIDKERSDLRLQINSFNQEILQLENNLGFFANSKGADALKKDVEVKVNAAKLKIEECKRKLKMLVNE